MKPSRYNCTVSDGEETFVFNTLTHKHIRIPTSKKEVYSQILDNPNLYQEFCGSFIDMLKSGGFIVDDATDERELLKQYWRQCKREDEYYLMVLPTYQCNLRCWYCTQEHENISISDRTINALKLNVINKLDTEGIRRFHLSWFGGEPTLELDRIIDFTNFCRAEAMKRDKLFGCSITTNGVLLDGEKIRRLHDAGVTNYQITFDGEKNDHDKIKVLQRQSAFETILANINLIAVDSIVNLRFNYTHENLKPDRIVADLDKYLNKNIRSNVIVNLFKVWQEPDHLIDKSLVSRLLSEIRRIGLTPRLATCGMCYADQKNFECVFPTGNIGKCDNHSPHKHYGTLEADGTLNWELNEKVNGFNPVDDESLECHSCRYLPYCLGPCVSRREEQMQTSNRFTCIYADRDSKMRQNIISYCRNQEIVH